MAASAKYWDNAQSFTRPSDTTTYTIGDLVANSTTAASVVPFTWQLPAANTMLVKGIRLRKNQALITNAQFRIHMFSALPVVTVAGDNGALLTDVAGVASWLECFDVTMLGSLNDGSAGIATSKSGRDVPFYCPVVAGAAPKLYGLIEALAAYVPASGEIFTATLIGDLE